MVCISLEPNSPLLLLVWQHYWFDRFPRISQITFISSASVAATFSAEEEFVMGDYLSDSVIRHNSTPKPLLIQIFEIQFLTHGSHAGTSLAHWVISPARERLSAGGRSESEGLYVGLAPQGQSPANHPRSQTECQHATAAQLIFPQNASLSHLCLPVVYCSFLLHFSIHCTTIVNIFTPTHTLSFAVLCFFGLKWKWKKFVLRWQEA